MLIDVITKAYLKDKPFKGIFNYINEKLMPT
ncbi:MAG: hypothetical protein ACI9T9_002482 [Oleiphilaceae bacterium]|jgi:hypothetical protein